VCAANGQVATAPPKSPAIYAANNSNAAKPAAIDRHIDGELQLYELPIGSIK
jgi:hypothetical protein